MTAGHATAKHFLELIFNGALLILVVGFGGWFFIRTVRRSGDPAALLIRWALTVIIVAVMFIFIGPMMKQGGYVAGFGGVPLAALGGLFLTIIWRTTIANLVATPIGNLYDGGSAPAEAKAFYSNAIAQRKRGNYQEALALVRKQLEKFPTDFEGQLLMADIQAENLNDLPGAAISIERICNQPGHPPRNVALALNILADWYLKLNQDRDAARETLQKIIDRLPDSEMSVLASQRIASLATTEHLLAAHDRKKFAVVEGVQNIGLLDPKFHPKPADADAAKQAEELVAHLRSHPLDTEAREKLAVIYADHYNRLDLATDQFEQLITHPNQPSKKVVHWLNKLADVQIRHGVKHDLVRETVQRIIDLYPNTAAAELAASRIALLKLELKGKAQGQAVKLGSYEQDIGLKMKGGG